jgi:hypothetical protein
MRLQYEHGKDPAELWGVAKKDSKHALVQHNGVWQVVERESGKRVKTWGDGQNRRTRT